MENKLNWWSKVWGASKPYILGLFTLLIVGSMVYRTIKIRLLTKEIAVLKQNYTAASDSLRTVQLQNGQLLAWKNAHILDVKDLQGKLDISKAEYKELAKKVGKVKTIVKIQTRYKTDTIRIPGKPVYREDTCEVNFDYHDQWIAIHGLTTTFKDTANTIIDSIRMDAPITVGFTDDYKVLVTSQNPYMVVTGMNGAYIKDLLPKETTTVVTPTIPKESVWKRFNVGIQAGFGGLYNLRDRRWGYGPYLGLGLGFRIF